MKSLFIGQSYIDITFLTDEFPTGAGADKKPGAIVVVNHGFEEGGYDVSQEDKDRDGAVAHDRAKPDKSWDPYPITVHTSGDPALLAATLRATWPDGVCTDTGIYFQPTVEIPLLQSYTRGVRFITGRG